MRPLFLAFFAACIIALPFAFAAPDAPASIWFEQNETPSYDSGTFSVNWTPVSNEPVGIYLVYIINADTGDLFIVSLNTSASGFHFSGMDRINYTFNISAVNVTGAFGQNKTSGWMYVYSTPPMIEFASSNPEPTAYTSDSEVSISVALSDPEVSKVIFEGSYDSMSLGLQTHDVWVDAVSDPDRAYITVDGNLSLPVLARALYYVGDAWIYIDEIYFDLEGYSWVKLSLYDPSILLLLNWNGIELADQFTYYGSFWNTSVIMASEGDYYYYVLASDFLNNTWATEVRTITYDVTSPRLTLASPANATYDPASVPLNYAVFDINPVSCWYEYNSLNTTLAGCANTTFEASGNAATLTLWVADGAGNINFTSVVFSLAAQGPSVPSILSTTPSNNTLLETPSIAGDTTLLSVVTDRAAECKYSSVPNTSFVNMTLFSSTNSTSHSITVQLSSGTSYSYYIRCRGPEGNITPEDYGLTFSTAAFKVPLQIDPSGYVLKNGSIRIDMVVGRVQSFSAPVKNRAFYSISGLNVSVAGSGASYLSTFIPSEIPANSTEYLKVNVTPIIEGDFDPVVSVSGENYTLKMFVNITVFKDYLPELNVLKSMRQNLSTRLYTLQFKGVDVEVILSEAESLQLEVNDAISLYNSGYYSEGMQKYLELNDRITALISAVADAESGAQAAASNSVPDTPVVDASPRIPDVPEDGNSKIIWYVLGGIILVVIAVVLATSIVPDDYSQKLRKP